MNKDTAGISMARVWSKNFNATLRTKSSSISPIALLDTSMLQSDKSEFNTRYQSPEYYYHHYCYYNYYVFIVFKNGALKEYGT